MAQPAHRSIAGPASDGTDDGYGPRFALRFEHGHGQLCLARPFRFELGTLHKLELDLGPLQFPLDLSAGPARFRTRRTRVRVAELQIELAPVFERLVAEPIELRALAPIGDDALSCSMRDAFGSVAFDVSARFEGSDLRVIFGSARAIHVGPAAPLARVVAAARTIGLGLEDDRGALRGTRVLSALLRQALTPHGFRTPDDRYVRLAVRVLGRHRIELRTLGADDPEPPFDSEAWERARRLAPIVNALARGERGVAVEQYAQLLERGASSVRLREEIAALGLAGLLEGGPTEEGPAEITGPVGRATAVRNALANGSLEDAVEHAHALADEEPCDAIAIEGLCAVADRAIEEQHPRQAAELLERASARRPTDDRLSLRLVTALSRAGRDGTEKLKDVALAAARSRVPGAHRGRFARDMALLIALGGFDRLAGTLFEIAVASLPNDPTVLEGLGEVRARVGEHGAAIELFDRAASAFRLNREDEREAHLLLLGARSATSSSRTTGLADLESDADSKDRLEMAEDRISRAVALMPGDPETLAKLASVRWRLDAREAATRAEDLLLEALENVSSIEASVRAALANAARVAFETNGVARARSFTRSLGRLAPGSPDLAELEERLDDAEVEMALRQPDRLLGLEAARVLEVLSRSDDPQDLLAQAAAFLETSRVSSRLAALERGSREERVSSALADVAALYPTDGWDADALLRLEALASSDSARIALGIAAAERLGTLGRDVEAALARARIGAAKRDMAMIRAALTSTERAGDIDAALAVVELALEVVGDGPARASLLAVRARLQRDD